MIATILIGVFFVLLAVSVPIGFAMGLATVAAIMAHDTLPMTLLAQRTIVGSESYALLAIPFFILAGNLMNGGGLTNQIVQPRHGDGRPLQRWPCTDLCAGRNDILRTVGIRRRGCVGAWQGADPNAMKKQGYGGGFAAALMASACVNGPIIPPSIPLVIYGLSVGNGAPIIDLFLGGVIPRRAAWHIADDCRLHHLGEA